MKDFLRKKFPRLSEADLDQLTVIIEELSSFAGTPRTIKAYSRLSTLANELKRILGRKAAARLAGEMGEYFKHAGHA